MRPILLRSVPPRRGALYARLWAPAVLLGLVLAACGGVNGSATPPAASGTASSATDAAPDGPKPTSWPGGVVEAVVILGTADSQIQQAGADLGAAAAYEDLAAMWGAADGLATLLQKLIPQVDRLKGYPVTDPAAAALDAAFPDMLAGATQLRDSITSSDAAGIAAGSRRLATGLAAYGEARSLLGPLVDQAILMQRILVK